MQDSWKTLVVQALLQIPVSPPRKVGIVEWLKLYQSSLNQAGIVNASPLGYGALISLWLHHHSDVHSLRDACIETVRHLRRPAFRFQYQALALLLAGSALLGLLVLIPNTATTYPSKTTQSSRLVADLFPPTDLERETVNLPYMGDYQEFSGPPMVKSANMRSEDGLYTADWILQQADDRYSLQLLSASKPDNIARFCQQWQLCDNASVYRSMLRGKPVYRLLYGLYSSPQQTQVAISQLPDGIKSLNPWARPIGQVKQEILGPDRTNSKTAPK